MPIKWSAVELSQTMDIAEQLLSQAVEPLEQARIVAVGARGIADLPGYVNDRLVRLIGEIERVIGGEMPWSGKPYEGTFKASIKAIRSVIPDGAIEAEGEKLKLGSQQSLEL